MDVRRSLIQSSPPYYFETTSQILSLEPPPMLIEGILPAQTITGITSYPGVGKTWFAFEMMRSIPIAEKFLNKYQTKLGSVLFVGSDASKYDYARQWRKIITNDWSRFHNPEEGTDNPFETNVRFLIGSDFMLDDFNTVCSLINGSQRFHWGEIEISQNFLNSIDIIDPCGFSLIIFDTLSRLTTADQNDNSKMEGVFRNIRFIAEETGASIILLHHNSKRSEYNSGDDWRGAMAQIGALDNWFDIKRHNTNPDRRLVSIKKFRGLTPEEFYFDLSVDETSAKLAVQENAEEDEDALYLSAQTSILAFLALPESRGGWFSTKQISTSLYESGNWKTLFPDFEAFTRFIRNRLNHLSEQSNPKIRKSGGGKKSVRATYTAILEE